MKLISSNELYVDFSSFSFEIVNILHHRTTDLQLELKIKQKRCRKVILLDEDADKIRFDLKDYSLGVSVGVLCADLIVDFQAYK